MCYGPICEFMQNPLLQTCHLKGHVGILRSCVHVSVHFRKAKVYCNRYVCFCLHVCFFVCLFVCASVHQETLRPLKIEIRNKNQITP